MTTEERLEYDALRAADMPQLPPALNENTPMWVNAIAVVTTYTLCKAYAIVRNNLTPSPDVIQFFGTGGIARIESIHPYKLLDSSLLPDMKDIRKMKEFVMKKYGVAEEKVRPLKEEKLKKLIYAYVMDAQVKRDRAQKERLEEVERNRSERSRVNNTDE